MEKKDILVIAVAIIVITINIVLWFFPHWYIEYMKLAKKSRVSDWMFQGALWKMIENPGYIWFPRAVFGVAFIFFSIMVFFVYIY